MVHSKIMANTVTPGICKDGDMPDLTYTESKTSNMKCLPSMQVTLLKAIYAKLPKIFLFISFNIDMNSSQDNMMVDFSTTQHILSQIQNANERSVNYNAIK